MRRIACLSHSKPSIVRALQVEPESALFPNVLPNRAAMSGVTARFSLMMS